MKIYITGASGRLGKAVMRLLPQAIPINLRDDKLNLKKEIADATHVIHLAGSLAFDNRKELWQGNYELTKRVVAALPKNACIVYASSISVYGKKLAKLPANELTPCYPDTEYAKSKYAAEQLVASHGNYAALRIGPIYGTDFSDYFKMIDILKKGKIQIIGHGKNHVPFVHVDDVAKAIKNSLNVQNGVYLISSNSLRQEEIFKLVCEKLGIVPPKRKINKNIAEILLRLTRPIRKLMGKGEFLTAEHINILANDRVFDCSKAKKYLKFKPRKTEDGIKEIVDLYLESRKNKEKHILG